MFQSWDGYVCCFSLSCHFFSFTTSQYRYGVTSVPTFALICGDSQEIVEGADIELLSNKVKVLVEAENRKELSGVKGEHFVLQASLVVPNPRPKAVP